MNKRLFLSTLIFLVININICSYADISDSLIAHYKFDGDLSDTTEYNNHGIENGNIQYVDAVSGKGIKLSGVHSTGGTQNPDHIKVNKSENLKFQNALSVSYFVRIDGNKQQTSSNCSGDVVEWIYGNVLTIRGDRNTFYFNESEFSSALLMNNGKGLSTNELPTVHQNFRHAAFVIEGNYIKIYINGVLSNEGEGVINFNDLENLDLYIGVQESSSTSCLTYWYPLDGVIDDLRIYNRVLSDVEIKNIYESKIDPIERESLIDLYNSTNGDGWSINTNWLGDVGTECSWFGVTCNDSKHVESIHLFSNNLNGNIPISIKNFTHLKSLLLHNNNLTGNIPNEILQIKTLESITLNNNNLDNSIISLMNQKIQDVQNLWDVHNDNIIGIEEAIYALQIASGLKSNKKNIITSRYDFKNGFFNNENQTQENDLWINSENVVVQDGQLKLINKEEKDPKRLVSRDFDTSEINKLIIEKRSYIIAKGDYSLCGITFYNNFSQDSNSDEDQRLYVTYNYYHYSGSNETGDYDNREHFYLKNIFGVSTNFDYQVSNLIQTRFNKWIKEKIILDYENKCFSYNIENDDGSNPEFIEIQGITFDRNSKMTLTLSAWDWADSSEHIIDDLTITIEKNVKNYSSGPSDSGHTQISDSETGIPADSIITEGDTTDVINIEDIDDIQEMELDISELDIFTK